MRRAFFVTALLLEMEAGDQAASGAGGLHARSSSASTSGGRVIRDRTWARLRRAA
jgi:hypothetical protein